MHFHYYLPLNTITTMNPNNDGPNYDPNKYDHYDIYFQDESEWYMRGFEAYE